MKHLTLKNVLYVSLICFVLAGTYGLVQVDRALGWVNGQDAKAISYNLKTASYHLAEGSRVGREFVQEVSNDYYDPKNPEQGLFLEVQSQIQTATVASRSTADLVTNLGATLLGGRDAQGKQQVGTIPQATVLLASFKGITDRAAQYLDVLADAKTSPLRPVYESMINLSKITADLDEQVRKGGNIDLSLAAFQKTIADIDALVAKPEIAQAIEQLDGTVGHLNGSSANLEVITGQIKDMFNPKKQSFWKMLALQTVQSVIPTAVTHIIPQHTVIVNTVKTAPTP